MKTKQINMLELVHDICGVPQAHAAPESSPEVDTMEALATHYKRISNEITRLKKQKGAIKTELIAEMDARQAEKVVTATHTISYIIFDKTTVDTEKLRAAGLYDLYSKTKAETRFTVT